MDLNIIQWNANGIQLKKHQIQAAAGLENIDIFLIQESLLQETHNFNLPGFQVYRLHHIRGEGNPRGLVTLVRNSIPNKPVQHNIFCGDRVEALGVEIQLADDTYHVYNLYKHHQAQPELE